MAFPTSPDGRWHYFISFSVDGMGVGSSLGHMTLASMTPALATNGVVSDFAKHIATSNNVSEQRVVIIGISLLAAP